MTIWDWLCPRNKSTCPGRLVERLVLLNAGNLPFVFCLYFFTSCCGKRQLKILSGVCILGYLCQQSLKIWYVWGVSPSGAHLEAGLHFSHFPQIPVWLIKSNGIISAVTWQDHISTIHHPNEQGEKGFVYFQFVCFKPSKIHGRWGWLNPAWNSVWKIVREFWNMISGLFRFGLPVWFQLVNK